MMLFFIYAVIGMQVSDAKELNCVYLLLLQVLRTDL